MSRSLLAAFFVVAMSKPAVGDLITVYENFNTDPGWSSLGNGVNGSNYGYQAGSAFAGGSVGEAGGRFTRSGVENYYADVFSSSFDLSHSVMASGLFDVTARNHPDFGNSMMVGFFNPEIGLDNRIGIVFASGDANLYWTLRVSFDDGTTLDAAPFILLTPNIDRTWSFSWDPNGGINGGGLLSANLNGVLRSLDLTLAQRGQIANGFNAFGFTHQRGQTPDSSKFADLFIDDLAYSAPAPVPEPSSIVLFLVGLVVMLVHSMRRRYTRLSQVGA